MKAGEWFALMNSFNILLIASGLASAGAAMSSASLRILPCSPEVLLLGQRAFGPGGELPVGRHQGEPWARSAAASGAAPGGPSLDPGDGHAGLGSGETGAHFLLSKKGDSESFLEL